MPVWFSSLGGEDCPSGNQPEDTALLTPAFSQGTRKRRGSEGSFCPLHEGLATGNAADISFLLAYWQPLNLKDTTWDCQLNPPSLYSWVYHMVQSSEGSTLIEL
jgi:hypothetical protein